MSCGACGDTTPTRTPYGILGSIQQRELESGCFWHPVPTTASARQPGLAPRASARGSARKGRSGQALLLCLPQEVLLAPPAGQGPFPAPVPSPAVES